MYGVPLVYPDPAATDLVTFVETLPSEPHRGTARTKARKRALDILFEADLRGAPLLDTLAAHSGDTEPPLRPLSEELVRGIDAHQETIDRLIAECLASDWTLARMPRVDRCLARLATYELCYTDAAADVVLAEAVGLAGQISTENSPAFLNGLLASVLVRHAAERNTTGTQDPSRPHRSRLAVRRRT